MRFFAKPQFRLLAIVVFTFSVMPFALGGSKMPSWYLSGVDDAFRGGRPIDMNVRADALAADVSTAVSRPYGPEGGPLRKPAGRLFAEELPPPPDCEGGTAFGSRAFVSVPGGTPGFLGEPGVFGFSPYGEDRDLFESAPAPAESETAAPAEADDSPAEDDSAGRQLPFKSDALHFTLRKLGPGNGKTLMIVGGIQGDEPGAFSAAALIASHYRIKTGAVWVVPDLNMSSILNRNRGVYGDMNRKFAAISPDDPDYAAVTKIKSILLDEQVDLVLNLHDGSGFYRPVWEDRLRNPKRWGQSLIIDQAAMHSPPFDLYETASLIQEEVNDKLLKPGHRYHINNTLTAEGNEEMAKTLSFFAVCNGKPAFGIESSKELRTEFRSYYHLQVIEAFMRHLGIEFERDFELDPRGVLAAINSRLAVSVYDNKVVLPLENVRPNLNVVPFKKDSEPDVRASKPLLALVPDRDKKWRVAYGNRTLTRVKPQFMDFDDSLDELEMELDGKPHSVGLGEIVPVRESFMVRHVQGYRVNAIGARKERDGTEADVLLSRRDFMPRFSMDRGGSIYRVEIYRQDAFVGMVLVRFGEESVNDDRPLTATSGPESVLGF